ncbi:TetR family transcriptional regulator [Ferribacterium limneticum]|uniref:TetR family transcriptional regulator n=1 Tax=Ferribacterium limneticum TaxID=76259 RepID=UPI001CFB05AB|nr:TetR family transcriptional regulator [Ferribacterium limneticum]UCV17856.1 TetR family transcriptional regulator [Ferribacterium limneticum]
MARKTKEEAAKTRKEIIDAARRVFHKHGVVRSTLEKIAKEAGVTRGAIYWYFKNKTELFFAMREDVIETMLVPVDQLLLTNQFADPLDAIEASLNEFFRVLQECPVVRELFEIMISRCEYVDEFSRVQEEVGRPAQEFLEKMVRIYQLAATKGRMRKDLDPLVMARDTWAFTSGLLYRLVSCQLGQGLYTEIAGMIQAHIALRRA